MKNYSDFIKETLIKFCKCELKTWRKYLDTNPKPSAYLLPSIQLFLNLLSRLNLHFLYLNKLS